MRHTRSESIWPARPSACSRGTEIPGLVSSQGVHSCRPMTLAEVFLLIAGGTVIYFLLRPLQRWLEIYLIRRFFTRHPRVHRKTIDVTDFTSHESRRKDNHHT